ncbi:MAG: tyrosine-type recombinase/integrase [Anaerolineae bacterium]|nr:tyrosine-type recombinase/integrase [Anaerolineae bacterium]
MNHRPPGSLPVSKAIVGFLSFKTAEGLADRTIDSYQRQLQKWLEYLGDKDVATITVAELTQYFSWLRNEYVPHSFGGGKDRLSPKTLRNFWITLSAFFTWACREFKIPNPMKEVPSPKFKNSPVEPFTQDEMQEMLKVCLYSREAKPGNRKSFVMRLPNGYRDQAIIMTLLDTGLRAMELCSLRIKHVDTKTGKVEIQHGRDGGAKGGKGRIVYLGKAARRALWRYLADREDGEEPTAIVFEARDSRPFNPNSLRQLIQSIAERAGVKKAHPHRFRHTFAITYLRSGGDVFTLQALLGHSSLDMVRRYAMIADLDVERAHRKASPADNWRL